MKETSILIATQTQQQAIYSSAEPISVQHILMRTLLWIWRCLLLKNAGLLPACQMKKSTSPQWLFVNVALCLALVSPCLLAPFIGQQTAFAAAAHQSRLDQPDTPSASIFTQIGHILKDIALIITTVFSKDFLGWVGCIITAGIVECPNAATAPWGFQCSASSIEQIASSTPEASNKSVTQSTANTAGGSAVPASPPPVSVKSSKSAYEQALTSSGTKTDWLSGDVPNLGSDPTAIESSYPSGHLIYTYAKDTTEREGVIKLLPLTLGLGFLLIGPLFLVVGYQFLIAAWKLNSPSMIANATEGVGRVMLAALAIGLSYQVSQMLISLSNTASYAVVLLHQDMGFPQTTINGHAAVSYVIEGDTPQSFRGLVMPMSLWGCVLDDFLGIIATRVVNAMSAMLPIVGGLLGLAGKVAEIVLLLKDLSEFALFLLSITLWAQMVVRIILINYYIILAPVAFACWGLPGQMGSQVLKMWFKGMLQLLFVQALQIFILTTLPSLMPDFGHMTFPIQNNSNFDVMDILLVQLPVLITTMAAVRAPKILMNLNAIQTVAQAGSMAGKAVGGVAATLYGIVNH